MMKRQWIALSTFVMFALLISQGAVYAGDGVPRMSAETLLEQLDSPDVMVIDVRTGPDFNGSELVIKNAQRQDYSDVASWADSLPRDKTLVLYCA